MNRVHIHFMLQPSLLVEAVATTLHMLLVLNMSNCIAQHSKLEISTAKNIAVKFSKLTDLS